MSNEIKVGQSAMLCENDSFDTKTKVVVLKIYKGGNVLVHDGERKRQVGKANLMPIKDN